MEGVNGELLGTDTQHVVWKVHSSLFECSFLYSLALDTATTKMAAVNERAICQTNYRTPLGGPPVVV